MIKIRLARGGRIHMPIYTIVAADARSTRDGQFLEKLGQCDPRCTESELKDVKTESISKWLKQGAMMTYTVKSLLKKNKIQIES